MKKEKSFAKKVKKSMNRVICVFIGHDLYIDAYINKDEGYEREYCKRCSYEKYNYVN